jgi:hypothetical protein
MRAIFVFSIVLISILGCRTIGEQPGSEFRDVENFEGELGMVPGVGWESVFEEVRGTCVDFEEGQPGGTGQEASFRMHLIENHSDLAASMNVSSASQIKAAIPDTNMSVSNKTKFALGNTYSINRYSVYALIEMQIRNETTPLNNVKVKQEIRDAVEANPDEAWDRYRTQCGDEFLSAYTTGGEFYGIVEIQTDSEEAQVQAKAEIEAGVSATGIGEASQQRSFEASLRRAIANKNHKIYFYQRGGAGSDQIGVLQSIEELVARANSLPSSVSGGSEGNARRISATFKDYLTLDINLPAVYRRDLLAAQQTMKELAEIQSKLQDMQADIDYIRTYPNSFEDVDGERLVKLRNESAEIQQLMSRIQNVARACQVSFAECTKPEDLVTPELELPARRETIRTINRDKVVVQTTLSSVTPSGFSDGWFNPPECYLLIEVGQNGHGSVPLRRTATNFDDPRCNNLNERIEIPIALIKSSIERIGGSLENAWINVAVMEDDIRNDDIIGQQHIWYKNLKRDGAASTGINNSNIIVDVGFEMQ